MKKKQKQIPTESTSSNSEVAELAKALLNQEERVKETFTFNQRELLNGLLRKHFTILICNDNGYISLLLNQHRYLKPLQQAPRLKLWKGEIRGRAYLYIHQYVAN